MTAQSRFKLVIEVLCLGFLAGCQTAGSGAKVGEAVKVGTTRADLFGVPAEYRALHMAMEKQLDQPVAFSSQPSGTAVGQQLSEGLIPFAIMTAEDYSKLEDTSKLKLLASGMNAMGKTSRKAHIVTKAKSHVKSVNDIAGKRFAFGKYHDLLTDYAARRALEAADVPLKKLLPELLPTTVALPIDGRLYCGDGVSKIVVWDLTINAGVIDEVEFNKLPETGGNPITGPSKDQFQILGETPAVPEIVIVAGPAADAAATEKLKDFLLNQAKDDPKIKEQLGITGFAEPDTAAYEAVREMVKKS